MVHSVLNIYIEGDDLKKWYIPRITEHNRHVMEDKCPNSGFDLAIPSLHIASIGWESTKVDLQVKCRMDDDGECVGFYTYPRSSISKTPLLLSNHVGIIDSGYRGNLIAMFRNMSLNDYGIEQYTRLIQVCHSSLKPFIVRLVNCPEDLGNTSRGTGGFGSTGK
jgi:dUTP pyrophosphatase